MENRRKVKARRIPGMQTALPTVWIVILAHAAIEVTDETTSPREKVSEMGKQVVMEKVPSNINLEYQSTCSCPSVVTCDENQTDTMLSYAKAWDETNIAHERVSSSITRARELTKKEMEQREIFPESTERIYLEEAGVATCDLLETEYLLDKGFSSEIFGSPVTDLFGGTISMFFGPPTSDWKDVGEFTYTPKHTKVTTRTRLPPRARKIKTLREARHKSRMKSYIRKLFNSSFVYPLLINNKAYYYDCTDLHGMDSLNDDIPLIETCEQKLAASFPHARRVIETFFSENKLKENYLKTFELTGADQGLFDLKKIADFYDKSVVIRTNPESLSDAEFNDTLDYIENSKYSTSVKKILSLLRGLFPRGVNVKWVDFSCNNFSTDKVGCDFENELLRSLLRRKKSERKFKFGGNLNI